MNKTKILCSAMLIGGALVFSSHAFASTSVDDYINQYKSARADVPLPAVVVDPTDLPLRYAGATVRLLLTVDATGVPKNIVIVSPDDPALAQGITSAISQWRFTPALKDGVPVETRIELPLRLPDAPAEMPGAWLRPWVR